MNGPEAINATDSLNPQQVRRGRRMAGLLFLLGFGPMLLATLMYLFGWGIPSGRSHHGELIQPSQQVGQLALRDAEGLDLAERYGPQSPAQPWRLLVLAPDCAADCQRLLYLARQVRTALGRDADRVERALALPASAVLPAADDAPLLALRSERPMASAQLILLDPLGNQVLRYTVDEPGKGLLTDLKRLLKLSQIG